MSLDIFIYNNNQIKQLKMNEYATVVTAIVANAIIKIFCFYIGYLTVKLGYNLMNDGIKGHFKFLAEFTKFKGSLISASPGLLFLLLGIVLIIYAMNIKKEVSLDTYNRSVTIDNNRSLPFDNDKNKIIDSLK